MKNTVNVKTNEQKTPFVIILWLIKFRISIFRNHSYEK